MSMEYLRVIENQWLSCLSAHDVFKFVWSILTCTSGILAESIIIHMHVNTTDVFKVVSAIFLQLHSKIKLHDVTKTYMYTCLGQPMKINVYRLL